MSPALAGFPGGSAGKESACNAEDPGSVPGWENPLEEEMAPSPVYLPGESPWTEETGKIQFTGLQRVRHRECLQLGQAVTEARYKFSKPVALPNPSLWQVI